MADRGAVAESAYTSSIVVEPDLDVLDSPSGHAPLPADSAGASDVSRTANLLVTFVCIALLGLNVWLIMLARGHEVAQLTLANEKLAGSIAQHVDSSLLDVEHVLDGTVFELEQANLEPAALERMQPALVNMSAKVEQLKSLLIYDASGHWMQTSEAMPNGRNNNSDREYFIFHRDNESREAHLGLPIVSRSTGEWVVPLSRRLNDAEGRFAGVALATIKLSFLQKILSEFKLGEQGATALALNGHLVVRVPFKESDIGRDVNQQPIIQSAARAKTGSNEEKSLIDHVVRIISFDHGANFPVIAVVAVGQEEVLRDWFRHSVVQTAVVLALCVLVIAGGRVLAGSLRRQSQAERRLRLARDALATANEKLAHLARDDGLTGLSNRRFFDVRLGKLFAHAQRHRRTLAVVMVDVDEFKKYNDRYGHVAGDECLRQVAQAVRSAIHRPEDLVARYGGEEMALLLPETDEAGARHVAEAARLAVQALRIPHAGSIHTIVTISLGVAARTPLAQEQPASLVKVADRALYRAKELGRNRTEGA
ncbi:sensor domain-containing diguanylate cyclase [Xylophilus sp. GOD-11R]|uniref:sensor domain-containing diguanylate cyclase n=1 Tax=Xylophilus sp. GOD-11R TaxID=3089814 RepID=UPI00298C5790|nr:sensor domain-containing diguanylate cyclase [Xylophilus sp. GOD-11R]WPB55370.1 sensor domain-containing diguanylate cyclase [Xylophilus sp. GOD-11R]